MTDQDPITQQERLAALYDVSSRLGMTLDLPELLNLVMDATIQLTGAERGFLVLLDDVTGELQTAAARNMDQETIAGESMEISRTVVRRAVKQSRPILTDNAQQDDRFSRHQSVIGFKLRSIMCAPLRARGRIIGAAYVDNRLFTAVFSQEDLDLLVAFANQAAMAIDNARLFRQTDEALARRVEELTVFQRIDQELNRSLDLDRVLSLALDWAQRLTGADGGSIGLIEADPLPGEEPMLRLLAYEGEDEDGPRAVPAGHPILAQVFAEKRSVHTRNVTPEQAIDGTATAAQLAVPIKREGEVIGLISLESQQENALGEEDVVFVERLADRAAVAIENSRLYEAVQAADKAKSEFVSLVTHELRIPLTSIKGYTDLILGGMAGPTTEMQKEFLGTVKRNLDRMSVLIRDLSDINRVESGRMKFDDADFDLRDLVKNVASDLREAIEAKNQTLTLDLPPDLPDIHADRTRIGQVLTNLVSNANKYTPENGEITVRVSGEGEQVRVSVTDTGIGISEEDQARLFSQFFRSEDEKVRGETGWGLGLSIVKKLIEAQGGQIEFESELDKGSTFAFTVPVATKG